MARVLTEYYDSEHSYGFRPQRDCHKAMKQVLKHHVYGIVLEHLGKMKARGFKKDRIHHWCKRKIAGYIKGLAFRHGFRVFENNPKNTSKLAYDRSGEVTRDKNDFSLCTFTSGKRYACDLSASYNIGVWYFMRTIQKAMASEPWEQLKAEVPELATRTRCTMSTLWKVSGILEKNSSCKQEKLPDVAQHITQKHVGNKDASVLHALWGMHIPKGMGRRKPSGHGIPVSLM